MRAPAVVAIVVLFHTIAVGAFVFMQGCGKTGQVAVEPPPAPIMPPGQQAAPPAPQVTPKPMFRPPMPVEPAPAMGLPDSGMTYSVQKGDSLSKIASRHGVSARELAELNAVKDPNKIVVGQKLVLPPHASATPRASTPPPAATVAAGQSYTVQAGDVLSRIASRHGTSVKALKEANALKTDKIIVGQKLVIPSGSSAVASSKPDAAPLVESSPSAQEPVTVEPITESEVDDAPAPAPAAPAAAAPSASSTPPLDYTVLSGDTLDEIAKLFIVSKEEILRLNNLVSEDSIKPGMKLLIPPPDL